MIHLSALLTGPRRVSKLCRGMREITMAGITTLFLSLASSVGAEPAKVPDGYELQHQWDFSDKKSLASFEFSDPAAWRLGKSEKRPVLELFRSSGYRYKVNSPQSIALLATRKFGDFVLECELRQTSKEYGHRDFCVFFGFQDAGHYYYAHFATKTDPKANQVFIVDEAPFTKITSKTNAGNAWGATWHKVRVERKGAAIKVYFDDMSTPVMLAEDKRFGTGYLGFGSYNDTGMVANARVWAPKEQTVTVEPSGTLFKKAGEP